MYQKIKKYGLRTLYGIAILTALGQCDLNIRKPNSDQALRNVSYLESSLPSFNEETKRYTGGESKRRLYRGFVEDDLRIDCFLKPIYGEFGENPDEVIFGNENVTDYLKRLGVTRDRVRLDFYNKQNMSDIFEFVPRGDAGYLEEKLKSVSDLNAYVHEWKDDPFYWLNFTELNLDAVLDAGQLNQNRRQFLDSNIECDALLLYVQGKTPYYVVMRIEGI